MGEKLSSTGDEIKGGKRILGGEKPQSQMKQIVNIKKCTL